MKRTLTVALAAPLLLSACALAPETKTAPAASGSAVTCDYRVTNRPAKAVDPPEGQNVPATGTAGVTLTFAGGPVQVTLDRAAAPCTAHSFESLAQQGFFNDTKCHRLTTAGIFVLQCGDPSGTGSGGPGYWFDDELAQTKSYPRGTVAMANSGPNTNGSQFFMVYADTQLSPNYTVFGRMDEAGVQVIEAIARQGITNERRAGDGAPVADATIKTAALG